MYVNAIVQCSCAAVDVETNSVSRSSLAPSLPSTHRGGVRSVGPHHQGTGEAARVPDTGAAT
jgi:hypothetical protein